MVFHQSKITSTKQELGPSPSSCFMIAINTSTQHIWMIA
ncbi:hypothetical protein SAG0136_02430 [Streptococcus agalactiae LMG 14747]|uniref:Uncharacterized protein n=1 Tax=Streptococcus agalactiae LMG 14747 TaxID=1154860 RepID=V6YZK1_STRAG|nr:hypothetical protein SAG0136_02430 [Streptococcus agalactiae LMG 14747]